MLDMRHPRTISVREIVWSCFAAALFGIGVQCGTSRASEFSWEIAGTQRDIDDENDPSSEVTRSTLEATYLFGATDDESGPYALATFLSRTSRVAMAVNRDVLRVLTAPPSKGGSFQPTEEATDYSVAGRYVLGEAGWYVGGALASSKTDHLREFLYSSTTDRTAYGIVGGKYVAASTSVELGAYATRSNVQQSVSGCTEPCATSTADRDTDELRLSGFHLGTVGQLSYALSGSVSSVESEVVTTTGFSGIQWYPEPPLFAEAVVRGMGEEAPIPKTFALLPHDRYAIRWEVFPTQRLGIRVGYTRWHGVDDLPDGDAYDLTGTWFVTRRVSASLMLISGAAVRHSDYNEIDSVALRVLGRF